MDTAPRRIDPERLFAQRAWVVSLARNLVGRTDADDVAQDALCAALEQPPRYEASLRPWLASVVRNLALQRRRSEARRRRRQGVAARPELLPATDELAARAELQRNLAEEVLALAEPYKTVVLMRYFEGLSAAEIARRTGSSATTIRSQLARGLQQLRRRLDRRYRGKREVWSACMEALAQGVGRFAPRTPLLPRALPTLWKGVLAMKGITIVLGAVAVVTTVGVWSLQRGEPETPSEVVRAEDLEDGIPEIEPGEAIRPGVEEPAERRVVDAVAAGSAEVMEAERPALTSGVTAYLADPDGRALDSGFLTVIDDEQVGTDAESGADGSVTLELEKVGSVTLRASHPGFADRYESVVLTAGETVSLGELRLSHAGTVTGRVEDEQGRPVVGAQVLVTELENERRDPEELRRHGPKLGVPAASALTDEGGRFRIDARVGFARVWAGAEGMAWANVGPVAIERGGTAEETLFELQPLRRDDRIEGIVLSPAGEPVSSAAVSYSYVAASGGSGGRTSSDAEGRFTIVVQQRAPHQLWIGDPEDRWSRIVVDGVQPGTCDLELAFQEPRWVELAVVDEAGVPVERFAAQAASAGGWLGSSEFVRDEEHPGGVALLRVPTHPFHVEIEARGYDLVSQGPFDVEQPPTELTFTVAALPGLHGRLVDADGDPVAGAKVELMAVMPEGILVHGFPAIVDRQRRDFETSDADGGFVHFVREAGEYVIRATADDYAPCIHGPFVVDPRVGLLGLELVLTQGGSIEGRVLVPPDRTAEGLVLGLNDGYGYPFTVRTAADGEYRVDGLTPGAWEVHPVAAEIDPGSFTASYGRIDKKLEPACDVYVGEVTHLDIDLRDGAACLITGSFALGEDELVGWTASLEQAWSEFGARDVVASQPIDSTGRFVLETEFPGRYALVLRGPESTGSRLELREELELRTGDRSWELALEGASLHGTGADGEADRLYEYRWEDSPNGHRIEASARLRRDAAGRFELPLVPSGRARIVWTVPFEREGAQYSKWETLLELEVEPGRTETIELPRSGR